MRRLATFAIGLCLLVPPGSLRAQQPQPPSEKLPAATTTRQQPTVRVPVELVDVLFTVVNRRLKFVTNLKQSDFKVYEDGKLQEIRFFSRETDLPLRVALLLDTSNSIRSRIQFEQDAAIDFLFNVVRPKKDMAFLMTFDSDPEIIQDFTSDVGKLRDAILDQRAGGGTALYDAITEASRKLSQAPPAAGENPEVRRVLVVISDGNDNLSRQTRGDALEACQRAGVSIYAISTSTDWVSTARTTDPVERMDRKYHKDPGDKVLEQFTDETGGRAFFPYHIDDLAQSFLDIGTELRSQYSLGYYPANRTPDGRYRHIRLVVNRKGLDVRSRKGYYLPSASLGPTGNSPGQ